VTEDREELKATISDVRAERDAANAALARVRALASSPDVTIPCSNAIIAALDGAGNEEPDEGCECPGAHECGVTTSTVANLTRDLAKAKARIAALIDQCNLERARAETAEQLLTEQTRYTIGAQRQRGEAQAEAASLRDKVNILTDAKESLEETVAALRAELEAAETHHERERQTRKRAELEAERLLHRIAKAVEILSEPGMWSDFASRARKALTDG
jgi:hypothetical protein